MNSPQTILVTGATGFLGLHLTRQLLLAGHVIHATSRAAYKQSALPEGLTFHQVAPLGPLTDWSAALQGVDSVVHLAARVHIMKAEQHEEQLYHQENALGTERLAKCAAEAGVRRFIYLSSIKVNGEQIDSRPFSPEDMPNPTDDYGRSKLDAERRLFAVATASGMKAVAIRPPLIYGPGVRANFLRLLSSIELGVPKPFGAIRNARSLVSVWNLCDLIGTCITSPLPQTKVLLVSDGVDFSTPDLIRHLAHKMDRSPRLISIPTGVLKLGGAVLGKSAEVQRLCGSLTVDIATTKRELNWTPPVSPDEAFARTVQWYLASKREAVA